MKKTIFRASLLLKASLLLFGFFLVPTIAFHPAVATAQTITVSCDQLQKECFDKCSSEVPKSTERIFCQFGCTLYRDLCLKHLGEIIKASVQEEMFLAEATLRVFEKMNEENPTH